jgi:signal transduction histidine kinase
MKLARKLILALVLVQLIVLAVSGWLRVQRELLLWQSDTRSDHELLARVLAPAFEQTWLREGRQAALEQLGRAGQQEHGRVSIRFVDHPTASLPAPGDWHRTVVPLTIGAGTSAGAPVIRGALEISESRREEAVHVRATVVRAVASAGIQALGVCAVVFALSVVLVGRPIGRLREKTRRIGAGDLSGPLELAQRDEIGELAADLNAMCERLSEAQRRLAAETDGRVRAVEQLQHADRLATVGKLSSGVAHEIGTPLGIMLAHARLIEDATANEPAIQKSARSIASQVERVSHIIRQLLDFARGQRPAVVGASSGDGETVNLHALAGASIALLQPVAAKANVFLSVTTEDAAVFARAGAGPLQQVLLNLLMNAIQAMPSGGEVTIVATRVRAQTPAELGGGESDYARLEVADQGTGMPPEVLAHIFEPFFTTKPPGQGTGLGLSVCHGIIREQSGFMTVTSEVGKGSRFAVHLPLAISSKGG